VKNTWNKVAKKRAPVKVATGSVQISSTTYHCIRGAISVVASGLYIQRCGWQRAARQRYRGWAAVALDFWSVPWDSRSFLWRLVVALDLLGGVRSRKAPTISQASRLFPALKRVRTVNFFAAQCHCKFILLMLPARILNNIR